MQIDESQNDDSEGHSLIDELADEYVTRKQSGESPTISEYCRRYPQLEAEIRELFPMLSIMEGVKHDAQVKKLEPVPTPERIGEYFLLREIGRGGMGVVYEARHTVVRRHVALKSLPQRLSSDRRALARFEREARAIAGIHHTNVVPLFEFGQDSGHYYLVMQLIDGQSLDKLILGLLESPTDAALQSLVNRAASDTEGKSAQDETELSDTRSAFTAAAHATTCSVAQRYTDVAAVGFQIASALDYAHRKGIIHRDVKPSNILLDRDGIAWLTDFGLAKTDEEELTQTNDFLGTLRYMAPERFRGQCDVRSDLYALGLTLYELLALRPAFSSADRIQLIHAIENSSPQALRKLDPTIPRDLETIVSKAIQHEPAGRYATAGEMAADLQRFLVDEPIQARQLTVRETLLRWRRRNLALANSLTLLVLLLLVMFVGVIRNYVRETRLRRQAEEAVEAADESRKVLQQTLYFAEMNLAGQASGPPAEQTEYAICWTTGNLVNSVPRCAAGNGTIWSRFATASNATLTPDRTTSAVNEVAWNPVGTRLAIAASRWPASPCGTCSSGRQLMSLDRTCTPPYCRLPGVRMDRCWLPVTVAVTLIIWDANSGAEVRDHPMRTGRST